MTLAIFDLDNTLLAGDSDYLWGRFLVDRGIVDPEAYEAANTRFYEAYKNGTLDIGEFLAFALRPLAENEPEQLFRWRESFVEEKILPIVQTAARELVERHRAAGHTLLVITATNRFVTEPIVRLYGIDNLIATEPEFREGRYTGGVEGIPSFHEGKVHRLSAWLADNDGYDLEDTWFYSDSHNDIPLLSRVAHPVAVDPDPALRRTAEERGWPVISLRAA
ncbi:HAD family hydrolase [Methylococcus sp. ANG]|uniref:histidinol-phosphatase n=1 Tax=unclassified Methylococcus TaxID=2618889 RepID=UPI001C53209A|nr:HAD family hydrolase [Methylococcus sp. Mc7]QXP83175.1 HAD-IB family hydrolase [Methylococcus sp. Mc7]